MKRRVVREWTCDRCGKTVDNDTIFRPYGIGRSKVHISIGIVYYALDKDLCSECANGLANVIENYMRR